jgi:hypothetical protein
MCHVTISSSCASISSDFAGYADCDGKWRPLPAIFAQSAHFCLAEQFHIGNGSLQRSASQPVVGLRASDFARQQEPILMKHFILTAMVALTVLAFATNGASATCWNYGYAYPNPWWSNPWYGNSGCSTGAWCFPGYGWNPVMAPAYAYFPPAYIVGPPEEGDAGIPSYEGELPGAKVEKQPQSQSTTDTESDQ